MSPGADDLAYSDTDDDEDGKGAYQHDPGILLDKLHLASPTEKDLGKFMLRHAIYI